MSEKDTYLVLGGGGMIGAQVIHEIASQLKPRWVMICSKYQKDIREIIENYKREFPYVRFIPFWGDVFLREEWNTFDRERKVTREQLLDSAESRRALYDDVFHDIEAAYSRSQLVRLILDHKPEVIVDSINTATAISYQDVFKSAEIALKEFDTLEEKVKAGDSANANETDAWFKSARQGLETLLISQSIPQLIRHTLLLHRAMREAGTRLYLKIGTTGTGGMGLNIPYTHSEDKPSATLMTKTAIAFAHTGLMFLMARTPNGPIVKEIKPGAMVGYSNITCRTIREQGRQGKPIYLFASCHEPLSETLTLRQPESQYERFDKLKMVVVDTGENGLFTKGEFETITNLWQMEYITPEEIAKQAVLEIKGSNTGYDAIAAIDSAILNPTYRAGYIRHYALEELSLLEEYQLRKDAKSPSVALGQLGPPELGKLLWEAYLMKQRFEKLSNVIEKDGEVLSNEIFAYLQSEIDIRHTITSIGLPILVPDGRALLRGPFIRIPESPATNIVTLTSEDLDTWANKGWIDLRPKNFERWRQRFKKMQRESKRLRGRGSAAITSEAYLSDDIQIGAIVAWIFNNEDFGYRIK
ncbi:MAG: hypothetical protein M3416_00795 [Acidobacteriota bacterium]|nr:hypothetical protein [Acidobacteriota bacterium]